MEPVKFLNKDNGQVIVAAGPWIEKYDRAGNMERVLDAPAQADKEWVEDLKRKPRAPKPKPVEDEPEA